MLDDALQISHSYDPGATFLGYGGDESQFLDGVGVGISFGRRVPANAITNGNCKAAHKTDIFGCLKEREGLLMKLKSILLGTAAVGVALAGATGGGGLQGFMTGGGSIISDDLRVTHGFHLDCMAVNNPQRLQINWSGNRFHLDQLLSANCSNNPTLNPGQPAAAFNTYVGSGVGTFNGEPGATISFTFTDAGEPGTADVASYTIADADGNLVLSASGNLDRGNQQAHDK